MASNRTPVAMATGRMTLKSGSSARPTKAVSTTSSRPATATMVMSKTSAARSTPQGLATLAAAAMAMVTKPEITGISQSAVRETP